MKKHTALFLSFSALLTLNAYAPQILWSSNDGHIMRLPANVTVESNKMEEQKNFDQEVQEATVIECNNQKKTADLEAEVAKLLADKEKAVKELEDLKKEKNEIAKKEEPKKDKDKKEDKDDVPRFVTSNNNIDVLTIISQLTSVMLSQQQQQQEIMNQMFSMMSQSMRYSGQDQVLSEYINPYFFQSSKFDMSRFPRSSFNHLGSDVGIQAHRLYYQYPETQFSREPSAQQVEKPTLQHYERATREEARPQFQGIVPHDGFNFGSFDSGSFERTIF